MRDPKIPSQTYRLFRFDDDGHIRSAAQMFDAPDDEAAIMKAAPLVNGERVELWSGSRLVHVFGSDKGGEG